MATGSWSIGLGISGSGMFRTAGLMNIVTVSHPSQSPERDRFQRGEGWNQASRCRSRTPLTVLQICRCEHICMYVNFRIHIPIHIYIYIYIYISIDTCTVIAEEEMRIDSL